MGERKQITWMRGLIVVFVLISAAIALVQYNSTITFIATVDGYFLGCISGRVLGSFLLGLVQWENLEGKRLGKLHLGRWPYHFKYVYWVHCLAY